MSDGLAIEKPLTRRDAPQRAGGESARGIRVSAGILLTCVIGVLVSVAPGLMLMLAAVPLVLLALFPQRLGRPVPRKWLGPLSTYVPLLVAYNVVSIVLAGTPSSSTQFFFLALATAAFLAGYRAYHRPERTSAPRPDRTIEPVEVRALLLLGSAPTAFLLFLFLKNGIPLLAADPNLARTTFFINGYAATLVVVGLQAAFIAAGFSLVVAWRAPGSGRYWAVIASAAALLALTANRGLVVGPALTVALFATWGRAVPVAKLAVAATVALTLFSYLGFQRNLRAFGPRYVDDVAATGYPGTMRYLAPLGNYVAGTSVALDLTIGLFPEHHPFPMGKVFFGPLLHEESADLYLKHLLGLNFVGFGLAIGAVNAFYLDFGWWGILIGFLIFGVVSSWLYERAIAHGGRWVPLYCLWLSHLILSNYGHPFAYLSSIIIPLVVLLMLRGSLPISALQGGSAMATGGVVCPPVETARIGR